MHNGKKHADEQEPWRRLVRREIKARGLTYLAAAERAEIPRLALIRWLGGQRPMRADKLAALFKSLGIRVAIVRSRA